MWWGIPSIAQMLARPLTGPPRPAPVERPYMNSAVQPLGVAGRELESLLEPDEGWDCWWHSKDDDPCKLAADRLFAIHGDPPAPTGSIRPHTARSARPPMTMPRSLPDSARRAAGTSPTTPA